jgi:hypothetical protein
LKFKKKLRKAKGNQCKSFSNVEPVINHRIYKPRENINKMRDTARDHQENNRKKVHPVNIGSKLELISIWEQPYEQFYKYADAGSK